MKRNMITVAAALLVSLAAVLPAGAQNSAGKTARFFTDSTGRKVAIPAEIRKIAPSGFMAQMFLYALVPDRLVGLASAPTAAMQGYINDGVLALPVFGQFYGIKSNLNLEALIAAKPDVIIDIGEVKKNLAEDLDSLQQRTGIPVIFIDASSMPAYAATFRTLGVLLNTVPAAEERAVFCEEAVRTIEQGRLKTGSLPKRVRIYYGEGATGYQTVPARSIHSEVIEYIGAENVAAIPATTGAGGSQVTMEQLLLWDPDIVIMGYGATVQTLKKDPLWQTLRAVRQGRAYTIPDAPYGWFGRPPSINRLLGLYWLGNIAYPDIYPEAELSRQTKTFYDLFYHHRLEDAETARFLERRR